MDKELLFQSEEGMDLSVSGDHLKFKSRGPVRFEGDHAFFRGHDLKGDVKKKILQSITLTNPRGRFVFPNSNIGPLFCQGDLLEMDAARLMIQGDPVVLKGASWKNLSRRIVYFRDSKKIAYEDFHLEPLKENAR
jgi:hypothetical protein